MRNGRFGYWRVFWVVAAFYMLMLLFGVLTLMFAPTANTEFKWQHLISWKNLLNQSVALLFSSLVYWYLLNQYFKLIAEKRTIVNYLKPTIIALVIVAVYQVVSYTFLTPGEAKNIRINNKPVGDIGFGLHVLSFMFLSFFYVIISLGVAYFVFLRDERKQRKILEEQKMQLEVEKSQANLNFLKAQINPHFLHNTLNFLYAKALPLSPELSEGILTLSDIMRYALSEGNAKNGKAPLKDEIEHVRNVIKIQQLRFENKLNVQFEVEGVVNGATIIPFVLITLVENAFKHGDLKSSDEPIVLKLKVENGTLYFYSRNRKKNGPKELSTGIGLENIKKRLDLTYGQQYSFRVKDENDYYTTELIIHHI